MIGPFRNWPVAAIVAIPLILSSCRPVIGYWGYDGDFYDSREGVLNAQRAKMSALLNRVPRTKRPVGGSAVVVLPTAAYVIRSFQDDFNNVKPVTDFDPSYHSYQVTLHMNSLQFTADAVKRRGIFDRVTIVSSNSPDSASFNEDYAIVFRRHAEKSQWVLKKDHTFAPIGHVIEEVSEAMPPFTRLILWLDNVEKISRAGG